jgi:exosortase A
MKVEADTYLARVAPEALKSAKREWLFAGGLTLAAVAWLLAWYGVTSASMVAIWHESETFAHGFLIFPISAWLIWGKRQALAHLSPEPSLAGVALLAILGAGWLFANVAGVQVVQQYAVVAMVPALLLAVLGWRVVRTLAFPLAFLLLAVPVGKGLMPPLMDFTADFTVTALQLTGMPVYREGTFFSIPSGNWSVVEGCSGIRYLIASFTGGCLFAYLSYRSLYKRLLFIAASIVVPIIANGLRAYLIVMIAHLSDMRLAMGIDHYIYGWVFFGFVMLLLFWVGSFWRDHEPEDSASAPPAAPAHGRVPLSKVGGVALAATLVAGVWPLYAARLDDGRQFASRPPLQAPAATAGWQLDPEPVTDWQPRYVGMDASLLQTYRKGDSRVAVYFVVYRRQRQDAELINDRNVLVPQKHPVWGNVGEVRRRESIGASEVPVRETRLRSRAQRLLIWDWLFVGNRHLSSPYYAKLLLGWNRLIGNPGQGAAIILATPAEQQTDQAERTLRAFVADMTLPIEQSLRASAESDVGVRP